MVDWIRPSIEDAFPPVTRPMTLLIVAGPLNAALSPAPDRTARSFGRGCCRPACRGLRRSNTPGRREAAIDRDLLGVGDLRYDRHRAGRDEGEGNLGAQSQAEGSCQKPTHKYARHG